MPSLPRKCFSQNLNLEQPNQSPIEMAKKSQSGNNEMSSKTRGANKASSRMKKQAVSFKSGKRTPKVLQKKPSEKTSFRFKIVVGGDDGVGKTSMVQQAVGEKDRQEEPKKTNPHYYLPKNSLLEENRVHRYGDRALYFGYRGE